MAAMAQGEYTLKELVSIVMPPSDSDAVARVARQVRHWTALDLLKPLTSKHTGTGVSRRYSADEVRKAALLVELSHYRIPAPVLEDGFETFAPDWPKGEAWRAAVAGNTAVFFYMAYNEHLTTFRLVPADAVITVLQPVPNPRREPAFDMVSAIVVNLTRLFGRLRL
jgi:hypothetical protein